LDGRQPTEREAEAAAGAARLQARVGSGSASPPPGRTDSPASTLSVAPVWPGGPGGCWPTRRCCQVGTPPGGAIGPNFRGTHGCCRTVLGARPQAKTPGASGARALERLATDRLRCSCTALSGGRTHRTARLRGRPPGSVASTQVTGGLPGTAAAAWQEVAAGTYGPEKPGRSPVVGWADSCHTVT
jgi:hypothetical protein